MDKYIRDVIKFIVNIKKEYANALTEMQEDLESKIGEKKALEIMVELHNEDLTYEEALAFVKKYF
jgi:hypothetical protein